MINYLVFQETNPFKKLDLIFISIKNGLEEKNINLDNLNYLINNIAPLINNIIKYHKFPSLQTKLLFAELLISELQTTGILLNKLWLIKQYKKIKILEYTIKRKMYFCLKRYDKYLINLMYKLFSNYGTSLTYLLISTLIISWIFWFLFYLSDIIRTQHYVWNGELKSIWYYLFVSLSTLSNLWADMSMAGNNFLIFLFSIEQVLGILLFWLLIQQFNTELR